MINYDDTICAIATSLTPSGIGIIRVSGNEAVNIVSQIFVNSKKEKISLNETQKIKYGYIYDEKNDGFIDEVLVLTFIKPHSYTAEDVVEIQCHGSAIVLKKIINLVSECGARIAEPGEFTKRAFLNGRIDLSKAESVSDIITSKNDYALKASFNQLKGNLSDRLNCFRKEILESIAFVEACLDDPEHMSLDGYKEKLKEKSKRIIIELDNIIKNYDNGRIIREGVNTAIIGLPNAGKSSLLNLLLNEERAIVTDVAGTTRDIIKESINLKGITLNIIDTAGIREDSNIDKIEKIGIEKAKDVAKNADLILLVTDVSLKNEEFEENNNLIKLCEELGKKYIILMNKIDKVYKEEKAIKNDQKEYIEKKRFNIENLNSPIITFSTKDRIGLAKLEDTIEEMFINKEIDFNNEIFISNERQCALIKKAKISLTNVIKSIEDKMPEDLLTIDLNDTYTYLSQVLGIEVTDDVVNEIFSKFCMGK